jgi:hypothetical protein
MKTKIRIKMFFGGAKPIFEGEKILIFIEFSKILAIFAIGK